MNENADNVGGTPESAGAPDSITARLNAAAERMADKLGVASDDATAKLYSVPDATASAAADSALAQTANSAQAANSTDSYASGRVSDAWPVPTTPQVTYTADGYAANPHTTPAGVPAPAQSTPAAQVTGSAVGASGYVSGQQQQPPQYPGAGQPGAAQPYPLAQHPAGAPGTAGAQIPPAFGPRAAKREDARPKRRIGLGIAAAVVGAALVGGVAGAGVTALVSNNGTQVPVAQALPQNVVVNDTESVNQVTAAAAKASPSVVTISVGSQQGSGTGSGVILSADGYVVTNTHVVTLDGTTADGTIQVKTSDGKLYSAKVVGTDPLLDLAVIKLDNASGLKPLAFADSDKVNVGDDSVAIGAPLGLSGTVTDGIISALNRSISVNSSAAPTTPDQGQQGGNGGNDSPFNFWNFGNGQGGQGQSQSAQGQIAIPVIQTDAPINPGNSGGALTNTKGELIGINVAILSTGGSSSSGQAGSIGVGFAVPSNVVKRVAEEIINSGKATHGLLGASVTAADSQATATTVGALISNIQAGGAAANAGLQNGDVVTQFNGKPITDQTDLTAQVRALAGGSKAQITYLRNGQATTATVTLGTYTG